MLLIVKGLQIKPKLLMHAVTEFSDKNDPWDNHKPQHVTPLGKVLWPDWVKEDIFQQFERIGVQDPYSQKLVEPFALVFGGRNNDGAYDLVDVNWDKVVDYFRWEASAWNRSKA